MTESQRFLPWGVVALAGLFLAYCARPAGKSGEFELAKFGDIPIVFNGRVQPLDTLARNALLIVSGRQTFVEELPDGTRVRRPAIRWLADIWADKANDHKVIRIENDQVIGMLGLQPREGLRYSLMEIQPGVMKLLRKIEIASRKPAKERDIVETKLVELQSHVHLIDVVYSRRTIYVAPDRAGAETGTIAAAMRSDEDSARIDDKHVNWGLAFRVLDHDYFKGDADRFNKDLDAITASIQKYPDVGRARFESFFNRFEPFYNCTLLYVFVFLLACGSWLAAASCPWHSWPKTLRTSAYALCILTFVVHTAALFARMYLMDRWGVFVTNLYSSAIFIGWGCVAVGLLLEFVYPISIGCVIGSVTGAISLIIAHMLSLSGDTLEMLVAVLDTNFWLATHVTCVTMGYTATFFAGFIGIVYVLATLFVPKLPRDVAQIFTTMIYGVICFATLLSFTGTVLGGIWADQSWGRFWGWDPKENGALLIVLMNALTLHARWGGMIKARGLAVLAILGNIVTAWSWFGVNMLGVGLHNYGFMEGVVFWLIAFVVSQVLLAVLGMFEPAVVRKTFNDLLALNPPPQQPQQQIKAPTA